MSASEEKKRLPGLDGIRGIAVGWVILSHLMTSKKLVLGHPFFKQLHLNRDFAVDLFFVLSGFLITGALLRDEARTGSIQLWNFYVKRAFRILLPLAPYLALILSLKLSGVFGNLTLLDFLSSVFFFRNFTQGIGSTAHLWSLSIEEQFYLLWPVFLVLTPGKARIPICLGLLAFAALWKQLYIFQNGIHYFTRTDLKFGPILTGAALALLHSHERLSRFVQSRVLTHACTAYASVLALFFLKSAWMSSVLPLWFKSASDAFSFVLVALLIQYLIQGKKSLLDRALNFKPLVWIGLISFSLYIWQQIFCYSRSNSIPLDTNPLIRVLASLVLATASYFLIEKPSFRLRKGWLKVAEKKR